MFRQTERLSGHAKLQPGKKILLSARRALHITAGSVTKARYFYPMKKETTKTNDAQLLDLLKRVLPKATHDPKLAGKIYQAIELELKAKARATAFEKFCAKVELPDLEAKSVADVKLQLAASFGDGDVTDPAVICNARRAERRIYFPGGSFDLRGGGTCGWPASSF